MRFNVVIDVDNAAFQDPAPGPEVARLLHDLASRVEEATPMDRDESNPFPLLDANGARVGMAYYEEA